MTRIACIGECMVELREEADGRLSRAYGGDTLNTAVYLARLEGMPATNASKALPSKENDP